MEVLMIFFFFSSRRRHTRLQGDWSSDVCSSDLGLPSSSCLEGTPSAETVPELAPRPGEIVVRKRGYDAFAGTSLDGALRARNVTSLVVTGTMTDICVLATVTAALHRQYRVTVVEDGVATLWPEIQRAAL